MGAPFSGGNIHGKAIRDINEKVIWVEQFVEATDTSKNKEFLIDNEQNNSLCDAILDRMPSPNTSTRKDLHVGILHFKPNYKIFPLLQNPKE